MSMKCEKWLSELGWSKAELAERLGVFASSVSRWSSSSAYPKYAEAYLELAIEIHRLNSVIRPIKRRGPSR